MNPGTGKDAWQMDLLGGRYNSYDLEIGETLVPLTSLRVILQCWHLGCQGGLEKQLLNLLPENENSYHQWSVLNFLWVVIICYILYSYHCYWVTKLYPTLCEPRNLSTSASLSFIISMNLLKLMSIESLMPSDHLILCHPLLLFPSIFPNIRVFSKESALHIYSSVQFSSVSQSCPTLCSANKPFHVVSAVLLRLQESVCASDWWRRAVAVILRETLKETVDNKYNG